jgi:hypothetical protein
MDIRRSVIFTLQVRLFSTYLLLIVGYYTGRFIVYPGIKNIYYRKTIGHVFTKPVQIEGTTEFPLPPPPVRCFSSWFTFLPLGDASVCSEKMAAPG